MPNRIDNALRNCLTCSNITMHLIGAEDIDPTIVVLSWLPVCGQNHLGIVYKRKNASKEPAKRKYETACLRVVKGRKIGIFWQDLNHKVLKFLVYCLRWLKQQ